jgi:hypothetical protein
MRQREAAPGDRVRYGEVCHDLVPLEEHGRDPGGGFVHRSLSINSAQHESGVSPMEPTVACPSCGESDMGQYCVCCGEKRLGTHDHSLRHYLGEALETFSHFDSKILRTAWLLLRWPGRLSADYLEGRRVRFVNPLRLFLLSSIIYFLFNSLFPYNAFTTPLSVQLRLNNYYPVFAAAEVARTMHQHGSDYAALEKAYDARTAVLSKTLVFSLIPVIALLRRAYQASRWYCGLLALLMAWSFFHIVWLFRFLLFEVTLRTL